MPPSPAMRISPRRRELRADNHKRGRSLESRILYRDNKEDDLALFNEVQNKERDNFLLQSNDDIDDIFGTKLKGYSDFKLGISIPARGESSDLLNAEGDKNDYEWLITPPETPLFSSLDDETPPIILASRGRPKSQPVSISRPSTMEKGYNSRGSPSPRRLSPSPNTKGKPFPATHSSPPPTLLHSPPSRGPSPPPRKSHPSRGASPSPRKSPSSRGPSPPPSKPSHAPRSNSPTPRRMSTGSVSTRGTSPIKTSRGNSPSPKVRAWQSNIPDFPSEAPPNLRTSLADRPASYIRGSSPASRNGSKSSRQSMSPVASRSVSSSHSHERDDEVDSLLSIPVGALPSSRAVGISKKPTKILSNSAPKRSFDVALRQMDRKVPQNMFRPLLSSVPSTTFYAGNASSQHHSPTSRNSSVTTSSNASSDQGTSGGPHDTEDDIHSNSINAQYPNVQDEVFIMDQADILDEDLEKRITEESTADILNEDHEKRIIEEFDNPSLVDSSFVVAQISSQLESCSKCNCEGELVIEGNLVLCLECNDLDPVLENEHLEVLDKSAPVQEPLEVTNTGESGTHNLALSATEKRELTLATEEEVNNQMVDNGISLNSKIDISEGAAGISLLLNQSSSNEKRHIVQSRSFTASSLSYDDFSYVNSMRSSIGHSCASISSSIDLESSTHRKIYEMSMKHKRSVSSFSGASSHVFNVPNCKEDSFEVITTNSDKEVEEESACSDVESNSTFKTIAELSSHLEDTTSMVLVLASEEKDANLTNNCCESMNGEIENAHQGSLNAESETESNSNSSMHEFPEPSVLEGQNDVSTATVGEFEVSDSVHDFLEESTVVLEDLGGTKARSLTLEEATDTILFCSSIVHNLAYEAANIAIEKDNSPMEEDSLPTVTSFGKFNPVRMEMRSRTPGKRVSKSQKAREKELEIETKPPPIIVETKEKSTPCIVEDPNNFDSLKPPKLESKCNCTIM
ncbi:hypothetical protein ACJIZ3_010399 [Penstemon smallii]|uniref:Uncharacterized protein n=1 Tax=Penstemon smallii TaxID=265156 RepID=A0ABD3TH40_9LAMI